MRYFLILISVLTIPSLGLPATLHVPGTYSTIQAAIDAAVKGDTVLVHPGTYVENIDFKGKAILVTSLDGPEDTIIDGKNPMNPDRGSTVLFISGEGLDSVLDGFCITGGSGTLKGTTDYGGNIFCVGSSPTIIKNVIAKPTPSYNVLGGGISCIDHSSPAILNNTIEHHVALDGAGIYCLNYSSPTISGNNIMSNSCDYQIGNGGGIFCSAGCDPVICGNTISNNLAAAGGAIIILDQCNPTIVDNLISGNVADWTASGIYCYDIINGTIKNNTIVWNEAISWAGSGGGIYCLNSYNLDIVNNIIANNTVAAEGGGIYCAQSDLTVVNNTIQGNDTYEWFVGGGGIYCTENSTMDISNTVIWENDSLFQNQIFIGTSASPSTINISHSNVMGGANSPFVSYETGCILNWGPGMIDADPLVVHSGNADFHLTYPSPCRDAGDNSSVAELFDFEGDPRIANGTVDMGADEFYTHLYWWGDALPGGKVILSFVGLPGTTPVQLWLGSGIMDPPMTTKYGDWYLEFPLLASVSNFGPIPSSGIYKFSFKLPVNIPTPLLLPFQSGIGMELTNLIVLKFD